MVRISEINKAKSCSGEFVLAINDTLNIISGKWKLAIIGSLLYGKKRFKEIEKDIERITPRMLSKELKELEMHGIISRIITESFPVKVEYELTKSGYAIRGVLDAMVEWGLQHRKNNIKKQ